MRNSTTIIKLNSTLVSLTLSTFLKHRHGVAPMDATEPTYVATTIFQSRKSYEQWSSSRNNNNMTQLQRKPETVFYEGTLVISSGM